MLDFLCTAVLLTFALGFISAFIGSMPMTGPLGVLFIARALARGPSSAVAIACGGALIEGLYACGVALALPTLFATADLMILIARGFGAVVIAALAILLLVKPSVVETRAARGEGFMQGVASTALNPTLIATWTIVVSTLQANHWMPMKTSAAPVLGFGVMLGTLAWFLFLLGVIVKLGLRFGETLRRRTLRVMGVVLLGAAGYLGFRFASALEKRLAGEPKRVATISATHEPSRTR